MDRSRRSEFQRVVDFAAKEDTELTYSQPSKEDRWGTTIAAVANIQE